MHVIILHFSFSQLILGDVFTVAETTSISVVDSDLSRNSDWDPHQLPLHSQAWSAFSLANRGQKESPRRIRM